MPQLGVPAACGKIDPENLSSLHPSVFSYGKEAQESFASSCQASSSRVNSSGISRSSTGTNSTPLRVSTTRTARSGLNPLRKTISAHRQRSLPERGDRGLDVIAFYLLAGKGLHGDAHCHAFFRGGLDLVPHGNQGCGNLLRTKSRWYPLPEQGKLFLGEGRRPGLGLPEYSPHLLDGVGIGNLGPGCQGELSNPVAEKARLHRVARLHRL